VPPTLTTEPASIAYQSSNYQSRSPELESAAVEKNCLYYGDNLAVLREQIPLGTDEIEEPFCKACHETGHAFCERVRYSAVIAVEERPFKGRVTSRKRRKQFRSAEGHCRRAKPVGDPHRRDQNFV